MGLTFTFVPLEPQNFLSRTARSLHFCTCRGIMVPWHNLLTGMQACWLIIAAAGAVGPHSGFFCFPFMPPNTMVGLGLWALGDKSLSVVYARLLDIMLVIQIAVNFPPQSVSCSRFLCDLANFISILPSISGPNGLNHTINFLPTNPPVIPNSILSVPCSARAMIEPFCTI